MRILLIEDDPAISKILKLALRQHDIEVDCAEDGKIGIRMAGTGAYDLIILDLLLPDKTGEEICSVIKAFNTELPIIAMTALGEADIKVKMFDLGVSDYITKPFQLAELHARIKSALKKHNIILDDILVYKDLQLDRKRRTVNRAGKECTLREKEIKILEYLMLHKEQVLTREMILNYVWGPNIERFTNVIDVHVHHLRDQIDKPFQQKLIRTVNSVGYKLAG